MSRTRRDRYTKTQLDSWEIFDKKTRILWNSDKLSEAWKTPMKKEYHKIGRAHERWIISNCLKRPEYDFDGGTYHIKRKQKGLVWSYV